jgi:hypothetical protein
LRALVLFAAVAGLALSASGCIIESSDNGVCTPDLTIPWSIRSNLDGAILTCAEAGGADTVTARIDGGGLATLTDFFSVCPATATQGSILALLPTSGLYNISVELSAGATVLSATPVLRNMSVDCSGNSRTEMAEFLVNF